MKVQRILSVGVLALVLGLTGSCKEEEVYTIARETKLACDLNGRQVYNGTSITTFQTSSVPFGQSCVAESRSCADGELSGTFEFTACEPEPPANCTFNGMDVAHDGSIDAFLKLEVEWNENCNDPIFSEERVCYDGQLSGSFTNSSCLKKQALSCDFDGKTVGHHEFVDAFEKLTYPFDGSCQTEQRYCEDGELITGSYPYSGGCVKEDASVCTFVDTQETIAHNTNNIVAYNTANTVFDEKCDTLSYKNEYVRCWNGEFDPEAFKYKNCVNGVAASCTLIKTTGGYLTVQHADNKTAFVAPTVPYGTENGCATVQKEGMCWNGSFTDQNKNILFGSGSYYDNCTVGAPAACNNLLKDLNNNFIMIADGESKDAYQVQTYPYQGQAPASVSVTCDNGKLFLDDGVTDATSAGYWYSAITMEGPAGCSGGDAGTAWLNQDFNDQDSITAFQYSSSADGSCSNSEQRICENGVWSGSYTYSNCLNDFSVVGARGTSTSNVELTWIPYDINGKYYEEYKYNSLPIDDMVEIDKSEVVIELTAIDGVAANPYYLINYGAGTSISNTIVTSNQVISLAVAVVIDSSQSMLVASDGISLGNDPTDKRYDALELLIEVLPNNSVLDVRDFKSGEDARFIRDQRLSTDRTSIYNSIRRDSSISYTPLYRTMYGASDDFLQYKSENRKMLITLTDGAQIDPSPFLKTSTDVITAANSAYNKFEVHNIGLGSSIDSEFKSMPNEITIGGSYRDVQDAEGLKELFTNLGKTASVGYAKVSGTVSGVSLAASGSGTTYKGRVTIRGIVQEFEFTR